MAKPTSSLRKYFALSVVILVAVAGVALNKIWGERYTLAFTEDQLAAKLAEKFPFDKRYFFFVNVHLDNPRISLVEGSNRISFGCEIETELKLEINSEKGVGPLRGTVQLSGKVRYEPEEGAFFLDEPVVETLSIAGFPEKWRGKLNDAVSRAAGEFLNRAPIYRLRPTDIKKAAARLVLRDVQVIDKKLVITMGVG